MHRVIVTGANKGIGLAIVKGILEAEPAAFVFLGSRDMLRGSDAVKGLVDDNAAFSGRVEALQIDVSDGESVSRAADAVRARFSDSSTGAPLTTLVNNAGVMTSIYSTSNFAQCIDVNVRGVMRTTEAFLPLLDPSKGRVVMISSSAGPSFVAGCSDERKKSLVDPAVTRSQINDLVDECLAISSGGDDVPAKFGQAGLNGGEVRNGYDLSKAIVNMYTMHLARQHPALMVNACTPGLIKTDLTVSLEATMGMNLDNMGAKPPSEGAKVVLFLTLGSPGGNGWYFGSDSVRSPLDRYRSPGEPAYEGEK